MRLFIVLAHHALFILLSPMLYVACIIHVSIRMLHLLGGLYERVFGERPCNILIVGAENSGKTTLVEQVKYMWNVSNATRAPNHSLRHKLYRSTVGLNFARIHADERVSVTLWDLGGRPTLRPLWENYYLQCHGIILVVDASTLEAQRDDVAQVVYHLLSRADLRTAPLAILLNKWDLVPPSFTVAKAADLMQLMDALLRTSGTQFDDRGISCHHLSDPNTVDVCVNTEVGGGGFGRRVFRFFQVSCLEGSGVRPAMDWVIAQSVHSQRDVVEESQ